jgi:hypothetical protein
MAWAAQVLDLVQNDGTSGGSTVTGGTSTAETLRLKANAVDTTGIATLSATRFSLSGTNAPGLMDEASTATNPTVVPNKAFESTGMGATATALHGTVLGVETLRLNATTNGVNYLAVTPAIANGNVLLAPQGTDTDVDLELRGKGTGGVQIGASGTPITELRIFTATIDPASVAANTTAEQTFTVTGLTTSHRIIQVIKPTLTAGLGIVNSRVSATDTIAITFSNNTGSGIDAASESYIIVAVKV